MTLQIKINQFIAKCQAHVSGLALYHSKGLDSGFGISEEVLEATEMLAVMEVFEDGFNDWTDYEKEMVIDYMSSEYSLNEKAIVSINDYPTVVASSSSESSDWVPSYNSLKATVDQDRANHNSDIDALNNRIDNLDFSNLVPQSLLDEVSANTTAQHTHTNKPVLDNIDQAKYDEIGQNSTHRNDGTLHVTTTQKTSWDDKVSQQELAAAQAGKSDIDHDHQISEIVGLQEAFDGLVPEKGDPGSDGVTPTINIGTVTEGEASATMDTTDPANPILNLVIPRGADGESFTIDKYDNASSRLSSVYDAELTGFTFLGIDNGVLYFRRATDGSGASIPATSTTGWYSVSFAGTNGWSPVHGIATLDDGKVVVTLRGWVGGTGDMPLLGTEGNPTYLGATGYTQDSAEAISIKGSPGDKGDVGKAVFPDATGALVDRPTYDSEGEDFMFLDAATGLLYRKLSDTSGDWSSGYQWRGDKGDQGVPGDPGDGSSITKSTDLTDMPAALTGAKRKFLRVRETEDGYDHMDLDVNSGFVDKTAQTIEFNDTNRTFTISPVASSFTLYNNQGENFVKNVPEGVQIANTTGLHMVYYTDAGVLSSVLVTSASQIYNLASTTVFVSAVEWSAATGQSAFVTNILKGREMSDKVFVKDSFDEQIKPLNGIVLGSDPSAGGTVSPSGDDDAHAQFSMSSGYSIWADSIYSSPQKLVTSDWEVFYKQGSEIVHTTKTGFPVVTDADLGVGATGRLVYNNNGTPTVVTSGDFMYYFVGISNDLSDSKRLITFMGNAQYSTLQQAEDALQSEIVTARELFKIRQEFRLLYSVLYQTSDAKVNGVKSSIENVTFISDPTGLLQISGGGSIPSELVGGPASNADAYHTHNLGAKRVTSTEPLIQNQEYVTNFSEDGKVVTLTVADLITLASLAFSSLSVDEKYNTIIIDNTLNTAGLNLSINDQSGALNIEYADNDFPGIYPTVNIAAGTKWRIDFGNTSATNITMDFNKLNV